MNKDPIDNENIKVYEVRTKSFNFISIITFLKPMKIVSCRKVLDLLL